MLINFTVRNYRSFKEEKTFSMEAASANDQEESLIKVCGYRLLPVAVFYGANSSGKSNLLSAIHTMRHIVVNSVRLNNDDKLPYDPFALDTVSGDRTTFFEIQFISRERVYRYGFEYTSTVISSEWLYDKSSSDAVENELFLRSADEIEVSREYFQEGVGKEGMTNSNRLFLSLVAQLKGEISNALMKWFVTCNSLSGIDSGGYEGFTLRMFKEHLAGADEAQALFQSLQLGFSRFSVNTARNFSKEDLDSLPDNLRETVEKDLAEGKIVEATTSHLVYDANGNVVGEREFPKNKMESEGTKKVIELSGPLFDTLISGKTLIVDELDSKLHPLLTRNIVLLFTNKESNKMGAQLIFATHDTNLLDTTILRRDEIWFAEKDKSESTDIYSLVEFSRQDGLIEDNYICGRYGAIPFIGK